VISNDEPTAINRQSFGSDGRRNAPAEGPAARRPSRPTVARHGGDLT
jgi:hypothetical protein